jgi:1,4-alpha-glucan branching enzyme
VNTFYRGVPAVHELDADAAGFEWIDCSDRERSVVSFLRRSRAGDERLFACNFTPVPRSNYRIGAPRDGRWEEVLNSDATLYGGSGTGNFGGVAASPIPAHGRPFSLNLTLPPLGVVVFAPAPEDA